MKLTKEEYQDLKEVLEWWRTMKENSVKNAAIKSGKGLPPIVVPYETRDGIYIEERGV